MLNISVIIYVCTFLKYCITSIANINGINFFPTLTVTKSKTVVSNILQLDFLYHNAIGMDKKAFTELHIDGLVKDSSIFIIYSMEILQSCTKPLIYHFAIGQHSELYYTF